ncbi:hypothetical protein EUGRSUZ_D01155 [Eucalyptus grandis]|uniref:Uncharacterized protein n=2 Tax=Eucalyptus grandis TaxID=71139 RepID=A0A059CEK3_EUCGR|nr:hypothetical protein EUGRSUZ_D01155 [Eucalyptus grandis]
MPVPRSRDRPTKVRIMLPMSVRCDACGNRIDKGSEFSSMKEAVASEVGLRTFDSVFRVCRSLPLFKFRARSLLFSARRRI